MHFDRLPAPLITNQSKLNPILACCRWRMRLFLARRGAASTPRSTSGPTAPLGRAGVGEQQEVALPRSSAVTGNGTVLRQGRTRMVAGAAAWTSLPAGWQGREQWRPVTLLGDRCATRSQSDATTSCTVLMAAMRGTAPCVSREPFIVTATGQYVWDFQTENLLISDRTVVSFLFSGYQCFWIRNDVKLRFKVNSWLGEQELSLHQQILIDFDLWFYVQSLFLEAEADKTVSLLGPFSSCSAAVLFLCVVSSLYVLGVSLLCAE